MQTTEDEQQSLAPESTLEEFSTLEQPINSDSPSSEELSSVHQKASSNEETTSQSSQDSVPEQEISVWADEKEEQRRKRSSLNKAINSLSDGRISPIVSTLNASLDDISSTQQKYYKRKAKETVLAALSAISPGQEQELWNVLRRDPNIDSGEAPRTSRRKSFDPTSDAINALVQAYDQAGSWQTERQILSVFANDFSKTELMILIPSLTKWRIDQARIHASEIGIGHLVSQEPIHRARISTAQVHHFVDFVSRPEMVQDVAFGTKTLKLDSGESIVIPAVVRTMIPSRIIDQYFVYCEQASFQPAGRRSLYRIIEVCGASMQKSLAGLDNTSADGSDAIDSVVEMVDVLCAHGAQSEWGSEAKKAIKASKRYLKTEFKGHVKRESNCADHCTTYALSDDSNKAYNRKCCEGHSNTCENCQSLRKVLQDVLAQIELTSMSPDEKARAKHELKELISSIEAWKAHLLRTVNQEEAKQDALTSLDNTTCLIIMDWAMKFLPHRYRERMSEFFGKRGRSWHVSAVITRQDKDIKVECFVHLFNSCTQNSFAVSSIIENLFSIIKKESPHITHAYLRSDNAGCYHSGSLLLSLPYIGQRTGISPLRYDFSDPQSGKDVCDRKIASLKAHIKRWVNEKHDVITADDMKTALESYNGVKGCRVAVVEVETKEEKKAEENKIPGISLLNNFAYTKDGIRVWRSYNNGLGAVYSYKDLGVTPQQNTNLIVKQDFGKIKNSSKSTQPPSKKQPDIFPCCERACILTFKTMDEAEEHMDTGRHIMSSEYGEYGSTFDKAKKRWAENVTELNVACQDILYTPETGQIEASGTDVRPSTGWALKAIKRGKRMSEKVKKFLVEKFMSGVSGHKADPSAVAKEMKLMKNDSGSLVFSPDEWRNAKQITSFFSRLSSLQKRNEPISEVDQLSEDDFIALQHEEQEQAIREEVMNEIKKPLHPIVVLDVDICDMVNFNKLTSLKVIQLRSFCKELDLEVTGPPNRKATYILPIQNYGESCSCRA